ncbi:MAG: hypothetical protein WCS17_11610 [Prevotella sp.]
MKSPSDDLISIINTILPDMKGRIIRQYDLETNNNGYQYITVKESKSNKEPEVMSKTSYHKMTINICMGEGQIGTEEGWDKAQTLWNALDIILDYTAADSAFYPSISNAFPIIEVTLGKYTTYTWDVDMVRYYG